MSARSETSEMSPRAAITACVDSTNDGFFGLQALVNRGAVLGAALFTLLSFITMGFVWTTVAKKLR